METEKGSLKIKRCSMPNSLIDNKKGDISVALCTLAPLFYERCNYPNSLADNKKGDISVALCTIAPLIGGMLQPFSLFELTTIKKLMG